MIGDVAESACSFLKNFSLHLLWMYLDYTYVILLILFVFMQLSVTAMHIVYFCSYFCNYFIFKLPATCY